MNKNLDHYLKIYRNVIDKDDCRTILNELENASFVTHAFYDAVIDQNIIHEHEPKVSVDNIPSNESLMRLIWNLLQQYVTIDLKNDWYSDWKGYTRPRFNKYEINDRMKNHCDHIQSMFDGTRKGIPTLSIIGSLNSDYSGGEIVMFEDEIINLNAGDVMIFPSNFLYPHKINPVTTGVRYSFVSWCY
jgi:predicted 2-oxoglutarate/Fe(II)-dependent dioxygenase YbiX